MESLARIEIEDMGNRYSYQYNLRAYTCVGFFAEVFATNPEQLAGWRKVIEERVEDRTTRSRLRKALALSRPGVTLATRVRRQSVPSEVDENGAEARLEHGILHLTLPKKQGGGATRLTIQ